MSVRAESPVIVDQVDQLGVLPDQTLAANESIAGLPDLDGDPAERDSTGQYLHEIGKTALLDAKQEVDLAKQIEAGLYANHRLGAEDIQEPLAGDLKTIVTEGEAAKDLFIRANLRLVVSIAKKYVRDTMPLLDLIQEGNVGLMRAIEKFDYERGYKLSTYATWWIRQAITRAIAQQAHMIRKPVHVVEEMEKVRRAQRNFLKDVGVEADEEELAFETGYEIERVRELLILMQDATSLDQEVGPDKGTVDATSLVDLVADDKPGPEETVMAGLDRELVHGLLAGLDDRSAAIMRARFGLEDGREHSLTEIASRFSLSRERIRQIELQSLGRLRELAKAYQMDLAA